jgi:hypothetical protein
LRCNADLVIALVRSDRCGVRASPDGDADRRADRRDDRRLHDLVRHGVGVGGRGLWQSHRVGPALDLRQHRDDDRYGGGHTGEAMPPDHLMLTGLARSGRRGRMRPAVRTGQHYRWAIAPVVQITDPAKPR